MHREDTSTRKVGQFEVSEIQLNSYSTGSLADDAVAVTDIAGTNYGQLILVTLDSGESAVILNDDGTAVKVAGNALFTITVTTDTKVNVYYNAGVLKVENKAGSAKTAYIKVIG